MKRIGYLRVSTEEQKPDRQIDGLRSICDSLHIECISAVAKKRPVFEYVLSALQKGDRLVVWNLDRAFRSTLDALTQVQALKERGIEFQVVTMNIDTSEPMGEFFFTVVAAFAQLERQTISQRTKEGLMAAKRRGKQLGRKAKLSKQQVRSAIAKIETGKFTVREVAALHGVDVTTIRRSIKRLNEMNGSAENS